MKKRLTKISRVLRKNQTPVEKILWSEMRNCGFFGYRFRRQYPIHNYVVDFCCPARRLIIELDGRGHEELIQNKKDEIRDRYFRNRNFTVLRFPNYEVYENLVGILDKIERFLNT